MDANGKTLKTGEISMTENKRSGEVAVSISGDERDMKTPRAVPESPHRKSVDSYIANRMGVDSRRDEYLNDGFLRYDNEKIYYPNSVLSTKPISNFYRSPDMGDSVGFSIDFATSIEKIGQLKEKIKKYLEKNPQMWHPNHNFVVKEIENVNKINMALFFNHAINFQDYGEKNKRRSDLVLELKKFFDDLKIKYNLLPQEVHLNRERSHLNRETTTTGATK